MTTLVRWNPMRDMMSLRDEMNRLFEQAFEDMPLSRWQPSTSWGLAVDVSENDDAFIITAPVPGVNPDDIEITISDNVLTIKGEFKVDESIEEEKYHIRERRYGSFGRSLTLPVTVNADEVEASYENGVLKLAVPKADEVKPRRIQIHAQTNGHKTLEGQVD
ncbi:MAG: Hsp20/alpha crystallin family protein [Candidatus Promineifilaceae bacterium]|nr:Hsp20/alpha crystallin family protein [Candidatus Promineifilaceae bacterium]